MTAFQMSIKLPAIYSWFGGVIRNILPLLWWLGQEWLGRWNRRKVGQQWSREDEGLCKMSYVHWLSQMRLGEESGGRTSSICEALQRCMQIWPRGMTSTAFNGVQENSFYRAKTQQIIIIMHYQRMGHTHVCVCVCVRSSVIYILLISTWNWMHGFVANERVVRSTAVVHG